MMAGDEKRRMTSDGCKERGAEFIYIAGLRRTGTTMLSEALTQLPYSFVFREPGLGKGCFNVKPSDARLFLERGVDLQGFVRRQNRSIVNVFRQRFELQAGFMVKAFKEELVPQLRLIAYQLGVKEIYHAGWRNYLAHFPHMKIVLLGRDPRDIYISLYYRWEKGTGGWAGPFTPKRVAADLNREFRAQLEMSLTTDTLRVRYEDLCTCKEVMETVKRFVGSSIPGIGAVGAFNALNPKRVDEYHLHGDDITTKRVGRWEQEFDNHLVASACETLELMRDYCEFWGYDL